MIVGKPGNGQSKFENYAIWFNTSNQPVAYFGNGTTYVSASAPAVDTAWHHLVATYDNTTARIYVDGVLKSSATSTVQLTPNALPLNVGRSSDNNYFFGGSIDEIAVYRSALSGSRVLAHYQRHGARQRRTRRDPHDPGQRRLHQQPDADLRRCRRHCARGRDDRDRQGVRRAFRHGHTCTGAER